MAKNQSRDPLELPTHWHIDLRLPAELPDDRMISTRFLLNLPFGAATVLLLVFFGWELFTDLALRANTADWSRKLNDSRVEIANIKQQQRDYAMYASKIESVHTLMKNRLFVSHFISQLSRFRPAPMVVDAVESVDAFLVVRGNISGTAEGATAMVGEYLRQLRADPDIGPRFESILLTSFERARSGNFQNFELTFRYRPQP